MIKILSNLNNFFFKPNINDLISDLKQKNFTNRTVLKYLEKIRKISKAFRETKKTSIETITKRIRAYYINTD